jgi:glycosyltransferase involved in cell wall biosynthesis
MIKVVHVLSLKGIGGVQQAFISYYKYAKNRSKFKHLIFSNFDIDREYGNFENFFKIKNNYLKFLFHLISKRSIIHFHNKLSDKKVYYLLKYFPASNIVFHEHGSAWNVVKNIEIEMYKRNARKADRIVVNSIATKSYLIKRFDIEESKIYLAYYGFNDPKIVKNKVKNESLQVGLIGRFDIFKGMNSFIEAAKLLESQDINFLIAGDGLLDSKMRELAKGFDGIKFVGRVKDPIEFIKNLDILIVPSIREPLGIVNIEAGLCKVPVIATNVDGIPEVITNDRSGILLEATVDVKYLSSQSRGSPPLPEFVVEPVTYDLKKPKEIDPVVLAVAIKKMIENPSLRTEYGDNLYYDVREKFNVEGYFMKLENLYEGIVD